MAEVGEGKGGGAGGGEAPASRRPPARPRLASPSPHPGTARPRLALPLHLIPSPRSARAPRSFTSASRAPSSCPFISSPFTLSPLPRAPFPPPSPLSLTASGPPCSPPSSLARPPLTLSTPSGALRVRGPLPALSLVFAGGWDKWGILKGEGSTG